MDNNETVRRLRWALGLDDADAVRMMRSGGVDATLEDAADWRAREDAPSSRPCPDEALGALLAGLIETRRGRRDAPSEGASREPAARLDNNAVLKALRIALALRTEDVAALVSLTPSETASLFRKPGTRNYRRCGDQVLRRFLVGLAERERAAAGASVPTEGSTDGDVSRPGTTGAMR